MIERIFAIRGAIAPVENNTDSISAKTAELFSRMLDANDLQNQRIVSVIVSSTPDLTAYYPATAIRTKGLTDAPLFSCTEPEINGSMKGCIRIMITAAIAKRQPQINHIYLGNAKDLRPDISEKESKL